MTLPLLLTGPLHTTTLDPESLDFQVRVGRPGLPATNGPVPCVLVLTRAADREIDELSVALAASGIAMVRLDSDRTPAQDVVWKPADGVLVHAGAAFRPVLAWSRYFTPGSVRAPGLDPRLAAYARDGWQAAATALAC